MQEINDFLKKCETYYLATVDENQPRVRPFGTVNLFDGKLYIQTGAKKDVVKQIAKNNRVEISAYDGATWIRLSAKLFEDENEAAQESMFSAYPFLKTLYTAETSKLYYLKDAVASFCALGGEPRAVRF
ncbi:MAG: pyridoxamine 5'-phosphate oxidase family protein [Christensenellaceae bacterium]|nr:pyridoxamine 5'-phosphate oxidase family protein [Christensenellaceae bacterium]